LAAVGRCAHRALSRWLIGWFREAEELMPERGVIVSYETIRRW
jgi:transposase-like protein